MDVKRLHNLSDARVPAEAKAQDDVARAAAEKDFLLKELDLMESEIKRLRAEGPLRLQFLFTITSALLASILVLAGLKSISDDVARIAAIVASCLLMAFSLVTFDFLIARDIASDRQARGTGRIRRYFLERSPGLERYVTWQSIDAPTQWVTGDQSGVRWMVILIAGGSMGLFIGLLTFELFRTIPVSYGVGIVSVVALAFSMKRWARRRFRVAKEKAASDQRFW